MNIKGVSLNLHCGMEEEYEQKLQQIIEGCCDMRPDFIALQECVQHKDQTVLAEAYGIKIKADNLAYKIGAGIKAKMGLGYDIFFDWGNYGFSVYEEGLAILSRYPIIKAAAIYVSELQDLSNWKCRKILRIETLINGQRLFVYSIHLGWWDDGEEHFINQFKKLHEWVETEKEALHLMMGDFNNSQDSLGYELMKSLGYRDLYIEANPLGFNEGTFIEQLGQGTIEAENINQRIDFILSANKELTGVQMERVFTKERYGIVSDHYGLCGTIEIRNELLE